MSRGYKISDNRHGCEIDSVPSNFITSNVIEDHQRVNLGVARRHAVAAASTALNSTVDGPIQDQARASADMPRGLRKTQSVRFTGPNANQKPPRSITRRVAPTWDHISSDIRRSPSKSPRVHSNILHGIEDKAISKSSYRRIKKSRSMFSPRKTFLTPTPIYEPKLRKKHSLLSGSTVYAGSSPDRGIVRAEDALRRLPNPYQTTYDQDTAIKIAQQEYRRQIEGLRGPRSLSRAQSDGPSDNATKTARKQPSRLFKRTVRTTSGNQYGASISSEPVSKSYSRDGKGGKARKVSSSLRKKILKILGIKSQKSLPIQQVESDRLHWSNFGSDVSEDVLQGEPLIPLPDDDLISRIQTRTYNTTPIQGNGSRTSSLREVLGEEQDQDRSRATSWANSTTTNDTALSIPLNERKRLTVIDENCDAYQPSTSTNVGQITSRSRYDAFRRPLKPGRINEPVDSQDMYMALQQRFDESNTRRDEQPAGNSLDSSLRSSLLQRMTSQGSYAKTETSARAFMTRASGSSDAKRGVSNEFTGETLDHETFSAADDVFAPRRKKSGAFSSLKSKRSMRRLSKAFSTGKKSSRKEKSTLRESRSFFFPSQNLEKPTGLRPYKLAIRSSSKYKTKIDKVVHGPNSRIQSPMGSPSDGDSIYSRHVTGTPSGMDNHLTSSESIANFGTATVRDSQVIAKHYSDLISVHSNDERVTSEASTLDWRAWATKQVAGLEDLSEENLEVLREDGNVNPWASESGFASNDRDLCSIPTPRHPRIHQTDGSYDFDYGFATSKILREQRRCASEASGMGEDSKAGFCDSSETSDRDDLPLTERKCSQSNVLHIHDREQYKGDAASYKHQSGENQRYPSSRVFPLVPSNSASAQASVLRNFHMPEVSPHTHNTTETCIPNEQDLGTCGLNAQTVVIRRNRRERAERLRRIKSSKASLTCSEHESGINSKPKHDSEGLNGFNGGIVFRTRDNPYETPGTGMLGPQLRYGDINRFVEASASKVEDDSGHRCSPAFL